MLDTFYTEVEGWLELTDVYASCHQCVFILCYVSSPPNETLLRHTLALQALTHALLLAPQNPLHVLYFAELAFLVPDIPLALKMYLQAVDMTDDDDQDGIAPSDTVPTGMVLRAWFGVKLVSSVSCLRRRNILKLLSVHAQAYDRAESITVAITNSGSNHDSIGFARRTCYRTTQDSSLGNYTRITTAWRQGITRCYGRDYTFVMCTYIDHCFSRFTLPYPETYDRFKPLASFASTHDSDIAHSTFRDCRLPRIGTKSLVCNGDYYPGSMSFKPTTYARGE